MTYHDSILYIANERVLHAIKIVDTLTRGEKRYIEQPPSNVTIEPGAIIHSLFLRKELVSTFYWKNEVIVATETPDN